MTWGDAETLDVLLDREQAGSTGVGHCVAFPHVRLEGLDRVVGVFVKLEQPAPFESVDDRPVDRMFAPAGAGAEHLRALAKVSCLLRHARTADAIYALLSRRAEPDAA